MANACQVQPRWRRSWAVRIASTTANRKLSIRNVALLESSVVRARTPNTQSITVLTDQPVAYLDPGASPDKPKAGYDLALAVLDFSNPGFAVGELDPAVKVALNSDGLIVTQDYGAAVVRLTSVKKQ